ncbi:MAG: hypothetical protein H7318_20580 [Oligoflexus sp.]|nr:hypothetical protein [Oligoflexus sp.]
MKMHRIVSSLFVFGLVAACQEKKFAADTGSVQEVKVQVDDAKNGDAQVMSTPPNAPAASTSSGMPGSQSGMPASSTPGLENGSMRPSSGAPEGTIKNSAESTSGPMNPGMSTGATSVGSNNGPMGSATTAPGTMPSGSPSVEPNRGSAGTVSTSPGSIATGSASSVPGSTGSGSTGAGSTGAGSNVPGKLPGGSTTTGSVPVPVDPNSHYPGKSTNGSVATIPGTVPTESGSSISPPNSGPGKSGDKGNGQGKGKGNGKDKDKDKDDRGMTSSPPKIDESDDGDDVEASEEECSSELGVPVHRIKVSGKGKLMKISQDEALFVKVTGNMNTVLIDLTSQAPSTTVKAICLSVAGGRNKVSLKVGLHVEAVYIKTRGKDPRVEIITTKGSVIDSISINARKSKGPEVFLSGPGAYTCDSSHSLVCGK